MPSLYLYFSDYNNVYLCSKQLQFTAFPSVIEYIFTQKLFDASRLLNLPGLYIMIIHCYIKRLNKDKMLIIDRQNIPFVPLSYAIVLKKFFARHSSGATTYVKIHHHYNSENKKKNIFMSCRLK